MSALPRMGQIVLYRLDDADAAAIAHRRLMDGVRSSNRVEAGDVYPMIVVRAWRNEFGEGKHGVNGQVLLDGPDQHWVTSVPEGNGERAFAK